MQYYVMLLYLNDTMRCRVTFLFILNML